MSKALKRYLAADLKQRLGEDRDVIVVRVEKLTVARANDLRNQLRAEGARMTVLRNRVARIAFRELEMEEAGGLLTGMTAVAHGGEDGVLAGSSGFTGVGSHASCARARRGPEEPDVTIFVTVTNGVGSGRTCRVVGKHAVAHWCRAVAAIVRKGGACDAQRTGRGS